MRTPPANPGNGSTVNRADPSGLYSVTGPPAPPPTVNWVYPTSSGWVAGGGMFGSTVTVAWPTAEPPLPSTMP